MRQVTKDSFFGPIFKQSLDVQPRITNDRYPYTSSWEFHRKPGRPVYGKSVGRIEKGLAYTDYFVSGDA